jgi:hypothetical protein
MQLLRREFRDITLATAFGAVLDGTRAGRGEEHEEISFRARLVAASFSGAAMAKDLGKKQMNDTELDKVVAGDPGVVQMCNTENCQYVGAGGQSYHRAENNGYYNSNDNRGAYFYQ